MSQKRFEGFGFRLCEFTGVREFRVLGLGQLRLVSLDLRGCTSAKRVGMQLVPNAFLVPRLFNPG